jgi:UDP-glucose 4-epimerase
MKRVFITGVTGFIAGFVATALQEDGYDVAGFARLTSRTDDLNIPLYRGSLTDREAVRWAVRDFQPEVILHLGAVTPVAYSFDHPNEVVETNLLGTINLAEAARQECGGLMRFVFASSMEVYGKQPGKLIDGQYAEDPDPFVEDLDLLPMCPYAVAKLAAEDYLRYMGEAYRFPFAILRQTNTYGRTRDDRFVVEHLVKQMLQGGTVNAGEPDAVRNFIHINDVVELYRILVSDNPMKVHGEVFNIGPANGIRIRELAQKLGRLTGWDGDIRWHQLPRRPGEIFYLNSSNAKITTRTGWQPRISLDEGLKCTVANWRKLL